MANKRSTTLFDLIKSLSSSEKRYFKLSVQQSKDTKYLKLFKYIDEQESFDEEQILLKDSSFRRSQFSNLKAHLYIKLLQSLRDFSLPSISSIRIRELLDEAQILFNKSLHRQSSQRLEKATKIATETENYELQLEVLKWRRQVLMHEEGSKHSSYFTDIIQKVSEVNRRINNINRLSILHAQLQALYRKSGYIRNEEEYRKTKHIFHSNLPDLVEEGLSPTEKIHLYHLYIIYYFFIQDFNGAYQYAKKWVDLFRQQKTLIKPKLELYITGLNYLLIAQNKLYLYDEFQEVRRELRLLNRLPAHYYSQNIRQRLLKYTFVHEFNSLFLSGDFARGVELIERISSGMEGFIQQLDKHSRLILFYKTACLYFGNMNFKKSIFWLNKILDASEGDLREDIHNFSRILMLISNYELGNIEPIHYYIRSTYRFLLQKKDLHQFQRLILSFLRKLSPSLSNDEVLNRFKSLRIKMLALQEDPFESRVFVYFDIVSWLESKIENRTIQEIIKEKSILKRMELRGE